MSDTPIADWMGRFKRPAGAHAARKSFQDFLDFLVPPPRIPELDHEKLAIRLLESRFKDQASPDASVRFTIDNVATRWFNTRVEETKGHVSRFTWEVRLGYVMGFFKFHRCRIQPQIQTMKERVRRKHVPTLEEIKKIISFLPIHYRLFVMIMAQIGARPDSILRLKAGDVEAYRGTDFSTVHVMESKRGANWGYSGFIGPEVAGELSNFLRSSGSGDDPNRLIFGYTGSAMRRAWTVAIKKAELNKTMSANGMSYHMLNMYTIRSFFKDVLDNAGLSKDWVDMLMGHRLNASDEAYTPARALFDVWKEKVYPQIAFNATPLVSEAIEYKHKFEDLQKQVSGIAETLNEILKRGKGALALTDAEIEGLSRKVKP